MKLYTESKVKRMMQLARETYASESQILLSFEPIKLPTDEEIELKSVEYSTNSETKEFCEPCCHDFQLGAKWMRDKIQGGNK